MELTRTEDEFVKLYRNISKADIIISSKIVNELTNYIDSTVINVDTPKDAGNTFDLTYAVNLLKCNLIAVVIRLVYVLNEDNTALGTDGEEIYRYDYKNKFWDTLTYNEFQALVINAFNLFISNKFKYCVTPEIIHSIHEMIISFLPLLDFHMSYYLKDSRFALIRGGELIVINNGSIGIMVHNITEKQRMYECPFKYYLDVNFDDICNMDCLDIDKALDNAESDIDEGYNIVDPFDYLEVPDEYDWGDDDEYLGDDDDDN